MSVIEVAPGVWAMAHSGPGLRSAQAGDVAAAAGMPGWRAEEFLAGRALLRRLLAAVLPRAATAAVVPGPSGKPVLAGWERVGVNVTHDDGHYAACAAVGRAVGIDVQSPPARLDDALLQRCVRPPHAGEVASLDAPDRAREFAWIWTVQEACVKAAGTGLSGRPWTIDVPPGSRTGTWRGFTWRSLRELSDTPLSCAWKESP